MKMSLDEKIAIAQKYCLAPDGCPKLKGKTDYNERLTTCAGCNNYLHKIDLIELLQHYTTTDTPTTTNTTTFKGKGKATEQSTTQIKTILTLYHVELWSINKIASELRLQHKTVKNIVNQTFKSEVSNEKVKMVKDKMINDGLL